ncbi:MAG: class I SAM-dependent methyltransferase [Acutalibacteraceae bacterium]
MKEKSMTAVISAFARAYHSENNDIKVFDDFCAKTLLGNDYEQAARNMTAGIRFFNPNFQGNDDEALRWIVDNNLSPSPLGRAAFTERSLENAVRIGAKQYLIFASGYDTFAYRKPKWAKNLSVFEIDRPEMIADKKKRLQQSSITIPENTYFLSVDFTETDWQHIVEDNPNFSSSKISFCSLLGISYYLSADNFRKTLKNISALVPNGSSIVFDYPDENYYTDKAGERSKKQIRLADGANETMLASYSYPVMEQLLSDCGFLIYEHLIPQEITSAYFETYNKANPKHKITALDNVNYCLAVKK